MRSNKGRAWKMWHLKHRPIPLWQILRRVMLKSLPRLAANITKNNALLKAISEKRSRT